jgi:hypothetical protein
MRWPWKSRADVDRQALAETIEARDEIRGRWPEVREAAASMRRHRERNHFAESIANVYRGRA